MKKAAAALMFLALILSSAFATEAPQAPTFSLAGGIYTSSVVVSISGDGDIYYTTDGSVPTKKSNRYTAPITIGDASTQIWGRRGEAEASIPAGVTVRAAVISGAQTGEVATQTYFIGKGLYDYFGNVPIVNLTAEPYDLWDRENGIYTNFNYEHKVPAVFQHVNAEGKTDINRKVEIKVSGHGSRSAPKKSIRVYFKNTDPAQGKYLSYNLIPSSGVDTFSKVTFRISDWQSTNLRDTLAQKIGASTRADIAESVPTALFLNGEYWGMYECREQYDEDYIAAHYNIDKNDVVYLSRDWTLAPQSSVSDGGRVFIDKIDYSSGPADGNADGVLGESYYRKQWTYIKSLVCEKDIASPSVYGEFCSLVDIDNLIDYLIVYIYSANDDWPGNNFELWRVTEEAVDPEKYGADGKWRFMIHDFDIAFENADHQTLFLSALEMGTVDDARHPQFATEFLDGLLKNADFRNEFAQRTMAYLSTSMSEESVGKILDELVERRESAKAVDLKRWGFGPSEERVNMWKWGIDGLRQFSFLRPGKISYQYTYILNDYYGAGITGTADLNFRISVAPVEIEIDGAKIITESDFTSTQFAGIPVTIKAPAQTEISVMSGGSVQTAQGELSFVPSPGSCQISIRSI